jgi:hypothetical protein
MRLSFREGYKGDTAPLGPLRGDPTRARSCAARDACEPLDLLTESGPLSRPPESSRDRWPWGPIQTHGFRPGVPKRNARANSPTAAPSIDASRAHVPTCVNRVAFQARCRAARATRYLFPPTRGGGSPSKTRTCDNPVNSRTLYQLSYRGTRGKGYAGEARSQQPPQPPREFHSPHSGSSEGSAV